MNEKEFTFSVFKYLKNNYSFYPPNFMTDFALRQIKSINNIFQEYSINSCFFIFQKIFAKI